MLGNTYSLIVLNLDRGIDANLLAQTAGCIKGGGMLVLLLPLLNNNESSFFMQRFINHLQLAASQNLPVLWVNSISGTGNADKPTHQLFVKNKPDNKAEYYVPANDFTKRVIVPTDQQQTIISGLMSTFTEQADQNHSLAVVLSADRGRGKSTCLAMFINELESLDQPLFSDIVVTSADKKNAQTLFSTLDVLTNIVDSSIVKRRAQFVAADRLIYGDTGERKKKPDKLLIIDEAASVGLPLLSLLTERFSRIIIATTVFGYEGSGRGFDLRFRKLLAGRNFQIQDFALTKPLRWDEEDQLEPFIDRFLCLQSQSEKKTKEYYRIEKKDYIVREIRKKELLGSEQLLRAIFSLLTEAHYQTQPSDLQHLLDNPLYRLWVAQGQLESEEPNILGVILAIEEAGLPSNEVDLAKGISKGLRRPKGNLLPQLLAYNLGEAEWCFYSTLRVSRIAVDPAARRCGVGTNLLSTLEKVARDEGWASWSSSFGFDSDVIEFWKRSSAMPVHLGLHFDKSSAARNLVIIKPFLENFHSGEQVEKTLKAMSGRLALDLAIWSRGYLIEMKKEDLLFLKDWLCRLIDEPIVDVSESMAELDKARINRFILGEIGMDLAIPSIARHLQSIQSTELTGEMLAIFLMLQDCIESAPDWSRLSERYQLNGKKAVWEQVRLNLKRYLNENENA